MNYKGYILNWDNVKGSGVVRSFDRSHPDLFLHWSSLPGASRYTTVNVKDYTPINYTIVDGYYGRDSQAHKIHILDNISRTDVVADILMRILDTESENQELFIRNILDSMYQVGRECGYLMYSELFKD